MSWADLSDGEWSEWFAAELNRYPAPWWAFYDDPVSQIQKTLTKQSGTGAPHAEKCEGAIQ
jgi:hypothetical protein